MSVVPRLDLRRSQVLTVTPRLRQAIKLLQMSSLELDAAVDEELLSNPFLEREEVLETQDTMKTEVSPESERREETPVLIDSSGREEFPLEAENDQEEDSFYEQLRQDDALAAKLDSDFLDPWRGCGAKGEKNPDFRYVDSCPAPPPTLYDDLRFQINAVFSEGEKRQTAYALLDDLDENGYLQITDENRYSSEEVQRILPVLQSFHPTGVFARNLEECLSLQLKEINRYDPAMVIMLRHLDLIEKREYKKLSKLCGVTEDELSAMISEIKRLNPRPAEMYAPQFCNVLVPDVLLRQDKKFHFVVELNQAVLPRVLINHSYVAELSHIAGKDKTVKKFINEKLSSANWLIKALNQRAETILKVACEIVSRQKEFFIYGDKALKPMVLRDIADATGLHESTISRVTVRKYIACPRGIYELKYFFSQGVGKCFDANGISAQVIRRRIKELIATEKKENILSDEALVCLLKQEGIVVARRTVAKYRESMGLPTSAQRKRDKNLKR